MPASSPFTTRESCFGGCAPRKNLGCQHHSVKQRVQCDLQCSIYVLDEEVDFLDRLMGEELAALFAD